MNMKNKDYISNRVNNVENEFACLPETGHSDPLHHLKYFSNIAMEHVQGYTQHDKYYILTHNTTGNNGYVLISDSSEGENINTIQIRDYSHPGGIQCAGKYLFVPCEHDNKSVILVYDLTNILANPKEYKFNHPAGCVGVTAFEYGGTIKYLMLIGDQEEYHAYTMDMPDDNLKDNWSPIGSIKLQNIDEPGKSNKNDLNCQGFGLVTDTNGSIFMVALMTHGTVRDCAYLFKLNVSDGKISVEKRNSRHLKNKGGISGNSGSHFRWGAGICVTSDNKLRLLCTSRNIQAGTKLNTCYW